MEKQKPLDMIDKQKPTKRPRLRLPGFFDEAVRTVIFVIVVTILFDMTIPRSLVDGRSMEPTFQDGQRLIVSRLNYLLAEPERGEIMVFNSLDPREFEDGVMLIKRVIGLPGDFIEWRDNELYINGANVPEAYTNGACRCSDNTWQLGEDEYFVMGDNRNNSSDSRKFGPVPVDHVVGRVVFRYWPLPDAGLIDLPVYQTVPQ